MGKLGFYHRVVPSRMKRITPHNPPDG